VDLSNRLQLVVLSSSYDLDCEQVAQALELLLRTKPLVMARADEVMKALRVFKASSADFADCLIERTASAGCGRTMTFDVGAAKSAGMTLIQWATHPSSRPRLQAPLAQPPSVNLSRPQPSPSEQARTLLANEPAWPRCKSTPTCPRSRRRKA